MLLQKLTVGVEHCCNKLLHTLQPVAPFTTMV